MSALSLFVNSFAVGLSGAMSPGPLLVVVIAETVRSGMAAPALMMAGHALLELAMAGGIFFGLAEAREVPGFEAWLSLVGGVVMVGLAADMIRNLGRVDLPSRGPGTAASRLTSGGALRLVGLGIGVSVMNPFWTVWWLTIGAGFMAVAGVATPGKAAAFYGGHILSDVVWYVLVGLIVVRAKRFINRSVYRGVLGFLSLVLGGFGVLFLANAWRHWG